MEACGDVKSGTRNSDAPNIGAEYEIAIFDKDGNEKRRFGGKANCFTRGFIDYIWHLSNNGTRQGGLSPIATAFLNTAGNASASVLSSISFIGSGDQILNGGARVNASANVVDFGIVFGRDATPVTLEDYNVGGLVSNDELVYDVCNVQPVRTDGNVITLEVSRGVANTGESPVSGLRSIAMYVRGSRITSTRFMILRDVVPEFDIAPGESAIGIYRMIFNGGS